MQHPGITQTSKHAHTWTNGIVSTWLSFAESYSCESPWRSLQPCNEPSIIQRKNQYNNCHQKLDFKCWNIAIPQQCTQTSFADLRKCFWTKNNEIQEKIAWCHYFNDLNISPFSASTNALQYDIHNFMHSCFEI